MESSTSMSSVPSGEDAIRLFELRKGQKQLVEYLPSVKEGYCITITWPTGYGKGVGFALTWKYCAAVGIVNCLLLIVANDTQRKQIINDFISDCRQVDAPLGKGGVWSFERSGGDIKRIALGTRIFVCTVQQLYASFAGGVNVLKDLVTTPGTKWMYGYDEFHHYGEDMAWGNCAKLLMPHASFILAMSAYPYRRGVDTIFPEPILSVTYSEGVAEIAVKPMDCHSYDYRVTVTDDGGETEYTTSELLEEAPDGLDKWEERKNIRYNPDYLHPLILYPLERLMRNRGLTGAKLQMLIRAMSCRHAEMVCQQVRTFIDNSDISVDWIGTGYHGRTQEANDRIRAAFCPAKTITPGGKSERPDPKLDILVQVSMAGEGFDSILVSEIVDLFPVSKKALSGRAVQDKQFYGRGSRIIPGVKDVTLHVSVPSDHPLHKWAGKSLHTWLDSSGIDVEPRENEEPHEPPELPDDFPEIPRRREIELINITMGDEHFIKFAKEAAKTRKYDFDKDKAELFELYRRTALGMAEVTRDQARVAQLKSMLDWATHKIGKALATRSALVNGNKLSGSLIGAFCREVNGKIKKHFGKSRDEMVDPDEIERAYTWCSDYMRKLRETK